ncbi:MAG TPA: PhoH family protein [Thermoanaerobaculia bacterium]|jgi:phosphate starvation-inducible PhoH-like protein
MARVTLAEEGLETLFGIQDQHLKRLERAFDVRIAARGTELRVEGEGGAVGVVEKLLGELSAIGERGFRLRAADIQTAIRIAQEDPEASLIDFFLPRDPTLAAAMRMVTPRGLNQRVYMQAMLDHDMVMSIGPAGTGKTFLAVAMAAAAFLEKRVRRIVLARPAVEAGEKLGFLPGDLAEKINPYLRPLYDSLYDLMGYDKVSRLLERGTIEVAPIAFMRGRTLNESFVILDEAQNTTSEQMKMFLTRMGYSSKVVVNGDVTQIDLPQSATSGLREALEILDGIEGIGVVRFEKRDVVRHPLVQKIVAAYDAFESRRQDGPRGGAASAAGRPPPAGVK